MEFQKYQHVEKLGNQEVDGILNGRCYIFPKLDGCFDSQTKILLADGTSETIGVIVNQKKKVNVLSYDFNSNKIVSSPIINWYKYKSTKNEWLTVTVSRNVGGLKRGGGRNHQIKCTKNHMFYVDIKNKKEVMASQLKIGDNVFVPQYKPTIAQEQVLLGTLLGDGHIYPNNKKIHNNGIVFSHSIKQQKYIDFKTKLIGSLYKSVSDLTSGYGSHIKSVNTKCNKITQQVCDICYKNNKKTVTKEWLTKLNSLGIAIWYMDDGTLGGNRAKISIEGFSLDEQETIVNYFINLGMTCYLQDDGKNHNILVFSPEGTINLFFSIAPYIIPSMQYKLLKNFKNRYIPMDDFLNEENEIGLIKRKILNITNGKKDCYYNLCKSKFDIEIGDTHNYFANNTLVHNSNASLWVDANRYIQTGSRRRMLSLENDNAGFRRAVNEESQFDGIKKLLSDHPHLRLFGEFLVKHSLKTYCDDAWRKFYVFDVVDEKDPENWHYVPYDCYSELLDGYGITYIPCIAEIDNPTEEKLLTIMRNNTYLIKDGEGCGEGIIVKRFDFVNKFGRKTWAKMITNEFKEKHNRVMGHVKMEDTETNEQKIVDKHCTEALIEKTYAKIVHQHGGWSSKYIPQLLGMVYHDLVTEELFDAVKKLNGNKTVNFKRLEMLCKQRIKQVKTELF